MCIMKMWYELTLNPLYISGMYSSPPALSSVEIFQVSLNRDGPALTLVLDGITLPDNPPLKWMNLKYNKIQITLDFFEVSAFELSGWCRNNWAEVNIIEHQIGKIFVDCCGNSFNLKFTCNTLRITKLSPYFDEA